MSHTPVRMRAFVQALLTRFELRQAFEESNEFHLRVQNAPFMPLVIERHGAELSIAHYGELNGDAMRDPEMTFSLPDWTPATYENSYTGSFQRATNARARAGLAAFAEQWADILRAQGFVTGRSLQADSLSHPAALAGAGGMPEQAEDAHLEAEYESRCEYEDYEPSPYNGDYSEE